VKKSFVAILAMSSLLSACSKSKSNSASTCTPNAYSISEIETTETTSGETPDGKVIVPSDSKIVSERETTRVYKLSGELLSSDSSEESNISDDTVDEDSEDTIFDLVSKTITDGKGFTGKFAVNEKESRKLGRTVYDLTNAGELLRHIEEKYLAEINAETKASGSQICRFESLNMSFSFNPTKTEITTQQHAKALLQINHKL